MSISEQYLKFFQIFVIRFWSLGSASVLNASNEVIVGSTWYHHFWNNHSWDFLSEDDLTKIFSPQIRILSTRYHIYSQLLESWNLVCSNQERRKGGPKTQRKSLDAQAK